jgi:hypothetical protein
MTIDAGMRAQVFASLKETHGDAIANALMEMLPPAGVSELATKADVGLVKTEVGSLKADVGVLKTDVGVLKTDVGVLKTEVAMLRSETKADIAELRAEMHEELKNQTRTFVAWMFSAMALCSTIAGGIGGLIVRLA